MSGFAAELLGRHRIVSRDLHAHPAKWSTKLMFTAPQISSGVMQLFNDYWLGAFYANDVKVNLNRIAIVLSVYAGLHVVINPIMGWLIDRKRKGGCLGAKRPFILVAMLIQAVSFAMLLSPPRHASDTHIFLWYLVWTICRGLSNVLLSTAYMAWAIQLTLNSGDRVMVFGLQRWFWQMGGLVGAAAPPYLVKWMGGDIFTTYKWLGMASGVLMVLCYTPLVLFGKEKEQLAQLEKAPSVVPALIDSCYNRPFRLLMLVYCIWRLIPSVPTVIQNSILFHLKHETEQGLSFFVQYGLVAVILPAWMYGSKFIEKRSGFNLSLVFGELLPSAILVAAPSLPASWIQPCFFAFSVVGAFTARVTFEDAMLADCIEYDQLFSGKRREGQYQAAESTLLDFASVFQLAIGYAILAAAGYKEGAKVQPAAVTTAARIVAAIPMVVMVVMQVLMMGYKLTKGKHKKLVRVLQQHQQGRSGVDPLTHTLVAPPPLVDQRTLSLASSFWRWERRLAVQRGAGAVVCAVATQVGGFAALAAVCIYGALATASDKSLSTVHSTLLNGGIVSVVLALFTGARWVSARRLHDAPACMDLFRTSTRPGMPNHGTVAPLPRRRAGSSVELAAEADSDDDGDGDAFVSRALLDAGKR